jgi:hypothetical protein
MTATTHRRGARAETSVASRDRVVAAGLSPFGNVTAASSREVIPASFQRFEPSFTPPWLSELAIRIVELSRRPKNWDSYGGESLQASAISGAINFLALYGTTMQSQPSLSLTVDGGLLFEWAGDTSSIEVTILPDTSMRVFYSDESGVEWDGPIVECPSIENWLWRSSVTPSS